MLHDKVIALFGKTILGIDLIYYTIRVDVYENISHLLNRVLLQTQLMVVDIP